MFQAPGQTLELRGSCPFPRGMAAETPVEPFTARLSLPAGSGFATTAFVRGALSRGMEAPTASPGKKLRFGSLLPPASWTSPELPPAPELPGASSGSAGTAAEAGEGVRGRWRARELAEEAVEDEPPAGQETGGEGEAEPEADEGEESEAEADPDLTPTRRKQKAGQGKGKSKAKPPAGKPQAKEKAKAKAKSKGAGKSRGEGKAKAKAKAGTGKGRGKKGGTVPDAPTSVPAVGQGAPPPPAAEQGQEAAAADVPPPEGPQAEVAERQLRDRIKAQKFWSLWSVLPAEFRDSFPRSRSEQTQVINSVIARDPSTGTLSLNEGSPFFRERVARSKESVFQDVATGAILRPRHRPTSCPTLASAGSTRQPTPLPTPAAPPLPCTSVPTFLASPQVRGQVAHPAACKRLPAAGRSHPERGGRKGRRAGGARRLRQSRRGGVRRAQGSEALLLPAGPLAGPASPNRPARPPGFALFARLPWAASVPYPRGKATCLPWLPDGPGLAAFFQMRSDGLPGPAG